MPHGEGFRDTRSMSERDRAALRNFYDDYGDREWLRLEQNVRGRVSFEVHRRFLAAVVEPGMRVLKSELVPGASPTSSRGWVPGSW